MKKIKVGARIRPFTMKEIEDKEQRCLEMNEQVVTLRDAENSCTR